MKWLRNLLEAFRTTPATNRRESLVGLEVRARILVDSMRAGAARAARPGSGIEPESIRRYQPGDDVRALDWRVTARRGELHVRRFEEEQDLDVLLVVDRSGSIMEAGDGATRRASLDLVAGLSLSAIEAGHRCGLVTFSGAVDRVIRPIRARSHWRALLGALEDPITAPGTDLAMALRTARGLLRSRSMVIVVSDFLDAGLDEGGESRVLLEGLARRHDLVPIVLTAPGLSSGRDLGVVRFRDPESGRVVYIDTARAVGPGPVIRMVEALRAAGLRPIAVDPHEELAPQLALRFGSARRRAA